MYPQGRMSHHFQMMREGDYLAVKGPKVIFSYQLRVHINLKGTKKTKLWNPKKKKKGIKTYSLNGIFSLPYHPGIIRMQF